MLYIFINIDVCPYLRSEEHTSELQSHVNLVCRLLLEKKNTAREYKLNAEMFDKTTRVQYRSLQGQAPATYGRTILKLLARSRSSASRLTPGTVRGRS